jgi:hypothetical protein
MSSKLNMEKDNIKLKMLLEKIMIEHFNEGCDCDGCMETKKEIREALK